MTIACARSQSPLAAHHSAASGPEAPSGASVWFTLRRNSSSVIACSPDARLSASSPPAIGREPTGGLLNHVTERKQRLLVEGAADELQPERQPLAVAAGRNSNAGQAGHVHRDGENVVQIHFHR